MSVAVCCEAINCIHERAGANVSDCRPLTVRRTEVQINLGFLFAMAQNTTHVYAVRNAGATVTGQLQRVPKASFSAGTVETLLLTALTNRNPVGVVIDSLYAWVLCRGQVGAFNPTVLCRVTLSDFSTIVNFIAANTDVDAVGVVQDSADPNKLWVSCDLGGNAEVLEFNKTTGLFNRYTLGTGNQFSIADDATFLYLSQQGNNRFYKFNKTTHAVVVNFPYAGVTRWLAGTNSGGFAYFGNANGATVVSLMKLQKADFTTNTLLALPNGVTFLARYAMDPVLDTKVYILGSTPLQVMTVLLSDFSTIATVTINSSGTETVAMIHDADYYYTISYQFANNTFLSRTPVP